MVHKKWLELYQYIQSHITTFPPSTDLEVLLDDQFERLSQQFVDDKKQPKKTQVDWLEHEAFTATLSERLRHSELTYHQTQFLFETVLAAQLGQLALTLINRQKPILSEAEYYQWSGLAYQQLGDYPLAKQSFENAVAKQPLSGLNHCYLGFVHLHLADADAAKQHFHRSIEVEPSFVGGYQNLAGLCYQDGEFEQSAGYAEQAFQLDKTLPATYITAVSSYLALGNKKRADQWIGYAFEHQVTSLELVRLAGITAHQNERHQEALAALNHYLSIKPESYDVLNVRAHVKAELGLHRELESDLKQLLVFEPYDEWSLEQLFLCYVATEQWQNAQLIMVDLNKQSAHYKLTYKEQLNLINKNLSLEVVELY